MQYTFDINITGCNNKCLHCYISGKPAPSMAYKDVLFCIDKTKEILDGLNGEKCIYLDCEIFNHPNINEIMRYLYDTAPDYCYFNSNGIPTTGLALLHRKDKSKIIETFKYVGCNTFTLTLHGDRELHNKITQNEESFDAIISTAKFLTDNGFNLEFNLMLSKHLIEDFKKVADIVKKYPNAHINLTIPDYIPSPRLRGFQKYRAELNDIQKLKNKLLDIGIDEQKFFEKAETNCELSIKETLVGQNFDFIAAREKALPAWVFFNVSHDMNLFYGNAGANTKLIGNLKELTAHDCKKIKTLTPNYGWSAFYNTADLPKIENILHKINDLKTNYIYSSIDDCIYSWLDYIDIKPILINK